MRRAGNLWPSIASFANLTRAAHRAAFGKREVAGVARFLADLEPNVLRLQRELEDGSWRPGQAFTFEIHDPKTRTITAAPFRDRVVHHALIDVLEPHLERRMAFESFACRRGKGTHRALTHARDDFALLSEDKESLSMAHTDVRRFLREELRLELKERATVLAPVRQGLPFLGWRIYRGTVRFRPENRRRMRARVRHRIWQRRTGRIDLPRLLACLRSTTEHLRHGSTMELRRKWLSPIPLPPL